MPQAGLSAESVDVRQRDGWTERDDELDRRRAARAEAAAERHEKALRTARERTAAAPSTARPAGTGVPGRRTIEIKGRGAERYRSTADRRNPHRRAHERAGFQPDRMAMWAVLLGVLMVLAAATSSHAAVSSPGAGVAGGSHASAPLVAPALRRR